MNSEPSKSLDILGVKPVGDAIKTATDSVFSGASAFLSRICLPAAEEFGLLLKDRVSHWRAQNAAKITEHAESMLQGSAALNVRANPRLVFEVIEKGSWTDDDVFQKAWAGILASSCSSDGADDSNIIFSVLLSQLTSIQIRILNHAVNACSKWKSKSGFPFAEGIRLTVDELEAITGVSDVHRLDRELDHLRSLQLISPDIMGDGSGFDPNTAIATVKVTALALHLYVRGQGYVGSPVEYFGLSLKYTPKDSEKVTSEPPSSAN